MDSRLGNRAIGLLYNTHGRGLTFLLLLLRITQTALLYNRACTLITYPFGFR